MNRKKHKKSQTLTFYDTPLKENIKKKTPQAKLMLI